MLRFRFCCAFRLNRRAFGVCSSSALLAALPAPSSTARDGSIVPCNAKSPPPPRTLAHKYSDGIRGQVRRTGSSCVGIARRERVPRARSFRRTAAAGLPFTLPSSLDCSCSLLQRSANLHLLAPHSLGAGVGRLHYKTSASPAPFFPSTLFVSILFNFVFSFLSKSSPCFPLFLPRRFKVRFFFLSGELEA